LSGATRIFGKKCRPIKEIYIGGEALTHDFVARKILHEIHKTDFNHRVKQLRDRLSIKKRYI